MRYFRIVSKVIVVLTFFFITFSAYAAIFIVDNLGDQDNGMPYTAGDGTNSLRKCIRLANSAIGADTVNFSVSGVIYPGTQLPALLNNGTTIDASSRWVGEWPEGQPGITLDGTNAGDNSVGLNIINTDNCHIRGLFIKNFKSDGIFILNGSSNTIGGIGTGYRNVISGNKGSGVLIIGSGPNNIIIGSIANNNKITGDYIGTDTSGIADLGNEMNGVWISGSRSNIVGGPTAEERNIISGNDMSGVRLCGPGTNNNQVLGNYIGTNVKGDADLGNSWDGVTIANGPLENIIGGFSADERNIISGNSHNGVTIENGSLFNSVIGNYIGTDASGTAAIGNLMNGVAIQYGSQSNFIGPAIFGALGTKESNNAIFVIPITRNIISGNKQNGVFVAGQGTNSNIIANNYIGTDANGAADLGNLGDGVSIFDGARSNIIGAVPPTGKDIISGNNSVSQLDNITGNKIAFNHRGVGVTGADSDYNIITLNSIHDNYLLGIDLEQGGNNEIPAPAIATARLTDSTLNLSGSGAGADGTVEFFKADSFLSGEGKTYLGSLAANASGSFSGFINVAGKGLFAGDPLVATTTHTNNNTSEFSTPVAVTAQVIPGLCCWLKEGWSFISFRVNKCFYEGEVPAKPECIQLVNVVSMSEWFSSVLTPGDAWLLVISMHGAMDSELPPIFHTLKYMSPDEGYWVKIKEGTGGAYLCIDGDRFDLNCVIPLPAGWTPVGCPIGVGYHDTETPPDIPGVTKWVRVDPPVAEYVFSSIDGEYSMIIGEYGAYDPALPAAFSSLHSIVYCQAFWIKMNNAANLKYPQEAGSSSGVSKF